MDIDITLVITTLFINLKLMKVKVPRRLRKY